MRARAMNARVRVAFIDLHAIQARITIITDTRVFVNSVHTNTIDARIRRALVDLRGAPCVRVAVFTHTRVRVHVINARSMYAWVRPAFVYICGAFSVGVARRTVAGVGVGRIKALAVQAGS